MSTDLQRPPYPVEEPDTSLGDLIARLSDDLGALFRDHVELAKEETKTELKEAATGAGLLGGAGLAGWIAALMLTLAAAWGLAEWFGSVWLGFLVVGVVWGIVAGVLLVIGRNEMKKVDLKPYETIDELEKDRRWLSEQSN